MMVDTEQFVDNLEKNYEIYKEKSLFNRRFKHKDIVPLIKKLGNHPLFQVTEKGKSVEGCEIYMIKAGTGKLKVLLWSQMHGNEPTATAALFDIFNLLISGSHENEIKLILEKLSLYFIPMVNPDGTQLFKRRNALDIDLNRDAARLEADETKILKQTRDELQPEYGFNLHDQECYYSAGATPYPATISFLAPSFNAAKDIDLGRKASMEQIVLMNRILQKYIPGQVGRYNDDFMPSAFGDNMQKWGTNTILIESGGYKDDPEKQEVRKMNFLCIMTSLFNLAQENSNKADYTDYFSIPENKKEKLFDLLIRKATIKAGNHNYLADIGIRRKEIDNQDFSDFSFLGEITEIGDLSSYFAYEEIDASTLFVRNNEKYLLIGKNADFELVDKNDKIRFKIKNGFIVK